MSGLGVVSDITVESVVKKTTPSKHYVFSIQVEWKNGILIQIYRSYDSIVELQQKLLKIEDFLSYLKNEFADNRTGYLLQEKTLFGKVTIKTRRKAIGRMNEVEEFLKSVVHLPNNISESGVVIKFFCPVPEDMTFSDTDNSNTHEGRGSKRKGYPLHISEPILLDQYIAICEYSKKYKNDIHLEAGNMVEVIYKAEHGWWFVDLDGDIGWVPASFLVPRDGEMDEDKVIQKFEDGQEEIYIVMKSSEPEFEDEVTLEVGKVVQVIQKNLDGWWLIRCGDNTGWAPSLYLRELAMSGSANAAEMRRESVKMSMNNIFAITERRASWNPIKPKRLSALKTTVRRHHLNLERSPQDGEDKPTYMNIELHGASSNVAKKPKSHRFHDDTCKGEQGPSYINLAFHEKEKNKQTRQRARRGDDMVELDFDKLKTLNSSEEVTQKQDNKSSSQLDVKESLNACSDSEDGYESLPELPANERKEADKTTKLDLNENLIEFESQTKEKSSSAEDEETALREEENYQSLLIVNINKEKKVSNGDELHQESQNMALQKTEMSEENSAREETKPKSKPTPTNEFLECPDKDVYAGNFVFLAIGDYTKDTDTEVDLHRGTPVQVLEQSEGGWWIVQTQEAIGWAPSNFIEKMSSEEHNRRKALGLVCPGKPPVRPPKSASVYKKALRVSTEKRFWSMMKKNENTLECSILDEKIVPTAAVGANYQPNTHKSLPSDNMVCEPETAVCWFNLNTKL